MDPNSANQLWSKWIWTVWPGRRIHRPFEDVKANVTRFTRKGFGSAGKMRITERVDHYIIELIVEGKPAHDEEFVQYMRASYLRFFENGFGGGTKVRMQVKVLAGSRQDGRPRDQWVELPKIVLPEQSVH